MFFADMRAIESLVVPNGSELIVRVGTELLASESSNVGKGESINIGRGDNVSINEIASTIGGEKTYIDSVLEPRETLADNNKAKKLLGWEPKMNVIDWLKSQEL